MEMHAVAVGHDAFAVLGVVEALDSAGDQGVAGRQQFGRPQQQVVFPILVGAIFVHVAAGHPAGEEIIEAGRDIAIGGGAGANGGQHGLVELVVECFPIGSQLLFIEKTGDQDGGTEAGQRPEIVAGPLPLDHFVVIGRIGTHQAVRVPGGLVADPLDRGFDQLEGFAAELLVLLVEDVVAEEGEGLAVAKAADAGVDDDPFLVLAGGGMGEIDFIELIEAEPVVQLAVIEAGREEDHRIGEAVGLGSDQGFLGGFRVVAGAGRDHGVDGGGAVEPFDDRFAGGVDDAVLQQQVRPVVDDFLAVVAVIGRIHRRPELGIAQFDGIERHFELIRDAFAWSQRFLIEGDAGFGAFGNEVAGAGERFFIGNPIDRLPAGWRTVGTKDLAIADQLVVFDLVKPVGIERIRVAADTVRAGTVADGGGDFADGGFGADVGDVELDELDGVHAVEAIKLGAKGFPVVTEAIGGPGILRDRNPAVEPLFLAADNRFLGVAVEEAELRLHGVEIAFGLQLHGAGHPRHADAGQRMKKVAEWLAGIIQLSGVDHRPSVVGGDRRNRGHHCHQEEFFH